VPKNISYISVTRFHDVAEDNGLKWQFKTVRGIFIRRICIFTVKLTKQYEVSIYYRDTQVEENRSVIQSGWHALRAKREKQRKREH
jgi:hypothetical protein